MTQADKATNQPGYIPITYVRLSDEQKREMREAALRAARSVGLSDEEWESYRMRPGLAPFQRDIGMIFDPVRKAEIVRETLHRDTDDRAAEDSDSIDLSMLQPVFSDAEAVELGKGGLLIPGLRTTLQVLKLDGETMLNRFSDNESLLAAISVVDEFRQQLSATEQLAQTALTRLAAAHVHLFPDLN